jgi:hypothetical protein
MKPYFNFENKCTILDNFIHFDLTKIAEQYCLFYMLNNLTPDEQYQKSIGTHTVYADNLMESLLLYIQPRLEDIISLQLVPTYSEFKVYKPGDKLEDRVYGPACEVSVALPLGCVHFKDVEDENCHSLHTYLNGEKKYLTCEPGGAIIWRGNELKIGMDRFDAGEGSYLVYGYFHYVDVDGPYAKDHKYDGRPDVGFLKK